MAAGQAKPSRRRTADSVSDGRAEGVTVPRPEPAPRGGRSEAKRSGEAEVVFGLARPSPRECAALRRSMPAAVELLRRLRADRRSEATGTKPEGSRRGLHRGSMRSTPGPACARAQGRPNASATRVQQRQQESPLEHHHDLQQAVGHEPLRLVEYVSSVSSFAFESSSAGRSFRCSRRAVCFGVGSSAAREARKAGAAFGW